MTSQSKSSIQKSYFGQVNGQEIFLYYMKNAAGMRVNVTNYGGIITSVSVPDRDGRYENVVLGYDNLSRYLEQTSYLGALVGRYANRIAEGQFELDGKSYHLTKNNPPHHLHGGEIGFDSVVWKVTTHISRYGPKISLFYRSVDGEEGYPGNLDIEVTYTLTEENDFDIMYRAITDAPTPVNLTQHTYFNLSGGKDDILSHDLMINAEAITPVDKTLIPNGEYRPVAGTPFDFREEKPVYLRINDNDEQLGFGGGYDHNFILIGKKGVLRLAASLSDPVSGRQLEVWTEEPGLQFYSGNFLNDMDDRAGLDCNFRSGLCLETQHFPDSPNQPAFPSTILRPGEVYETRTVFRFQIICPQ